MEFLYKCDNLVFSYNSRFNISTKFSLLLLRKMDCTRYQLPEICFMNKKLNFLYQKGCSTLSESDLFLNK